MKNFGLPDAEILGPWPRYSIRRKVSRPYMIHGWMRYFANSMDTMGKSRKLVWRGPKEAIKHSIQNLSSLNMMLELGT